jgi:hypothetical protein
MRSCRKKPWSGTIRFKMTPDDDLVAKAIPISDAENEFKGMVLYLNEQ